MKPSVLDYQKSKPAMPNISKKLREFLPTELLARLPQLQQLAESSFAGITADSRQVKPGMIFVATRGQTQDGHVYISQAVLAGASLIIGEDALDLGSLRVPYLQVPNGRKALAEIAASFYGHPSRSMVMVGVTGTSGKTTTTYLVESILKSANYKVGMIGTISFRYPGKTLDSTHTTPGAVELQKMLAEMRDAGCTAVVMEVSSHALKQSRAAHIAWDAMIFTNLTPEHLDFHPDMEDYYRSKAILFTELAQASTQVGKKPVASISIDTEYGLRLVQEISNNNPSHFKEIFSSSLTRADARLCGSAVSIHLQGIQGEVGGVKIQSALTSKFNISNILGAIGVGLGLGIKVDAIERGIRALEKVPGRLEAVTNTAGLQILVDYAHKPDALEKVLHNLRAVKGSARLITVFGCGGDRDRTKRPVMGKMAVELSDLVFITSDNPRTENPMAIIEEILQGVQGHQNFHVDPDRRSAIFSAIRAARKGDLVLIAGKGHEDYQIIGTGKIHFDDREVALEAVQAVSQELAQ